MMVISSNIDEVLFWLRYVHYLGLNFMPIIIVHFCLILTDMYKKRKRLIILLYLLGLFLQIATFSNLMVTVKNYSPFNFYTKAESMYSIFF